MRSLALATALVVGAAGQASAQPSVQLNHYRSGELVDDAFALSRPNVGPHLEFSAQLSLDYASSPFTASLGNADAVPVVDDQLTAYVGASIALWDRVAFSIGLPFNLVQSGSLLEGLPSADGPAVSDPRLSARVLIFESERFALGGQLGATFPVGNAIHQDQRYTGEIGMTFVPEVLAEVILPHDIRIQVNAGARFRALDNATVVRALDISHEFVWGLGASMPVFTHRGHRLTTYAQGFGRNTFEHFADGTLSAVEALLGVRYRHPSALQAGVAASTGVVNGYGSPDFRLVASIGWTRSLAARPEAPAIDPESIDSDGDRVPDYRDLLPNTPEDVDGFEDEDGAPDPDNDQDGILDGADEAPLDPEDIDGFEDEDGVPDPDNDGDGVPDVSDDEPMNAEDMDGFEDHDGVPELDNDEDGVPDDEDRCPDDASAEGGFGGCPPVVIENIQFGLESAELSAGAVATLERIVEALRLNPEFTTLRIEGHADHQGTPFLNRRLSRERSTAVRDWLVSHGVSDERLTAVACGDRSPLRVGSNEEDFAANRRVQFVAVPDGVRGPRRCASHAE